MKVSDYIVERLVEEGVKTVFGYQGGNVSHLIDSIGRDSRLEFVENYNEQASAFAANSYAQKNDTIGVAIASSGPGAINLLNGIANAFLDSIPCLFITGDVNSSTKKVNKNVRQNSFQEVDIVSMSNAITKYSITISKIEDIIYELDKAIEIAKLGRKGPVLINLPHDIQRSELCYIEKEKKVENLKDTEKLYNMYDIEKEIIEATRPIILIGGGMKNLECKRLLKLFLEKNKIPVVTSLNGIDVLSHENECYIGVIGSYGNRAANLSLCFSDCIIVLGNRLDDRQLTNSDILQLDEKKIIHIDIDENELGNRINKCIKIKGDIKEFLTYMINNIKIEKEYTEWMNITRMLKEKFPSHHSEIKKIHPSDFIYNLSLNVNDIFTLDVGNNLIYAMQSLYVKDKSQVFLSGGLGAMGYSIPAAIGACYPQKNQKVYCIVGDGGIQMNLQELQTIDYNKLPINIILLNNNSLGMIYNLQKNIFKDNYIGSIDGYSTPNFKKIAEAYNFKYILVDSIEMYEEAIYNLKKHKQVFVELQFNVNQEMIYEPGKNTFEQDQEVLIEKLKDYTFSFYIKK